MPMFQEAMDGLRSLAKVIDPREREKQARLERQKAFTNSLPRGDGKNPNLIPTLPGGWEIRLIEQGTTPFGAFLYVCILQHKANESLSMMGRGINARAAVLDAMKIQGLKEPE